MVPLEVHREVGGLSFQNTSVLIDKLARLRESQGSDHKSERKGYVSYLKFFSFSTFPSKKINVIYRLIFPSAKPPYYLMTSTAACVDAIQAAFQTVPRRQRH